MTGSIKGITIQLNGDTSSLVSAISDVNKESKNTQKELKEVERALKMSPGNTDLIAQKQQLLARSIEQTRDKLDVLRTAQQQVEQQFADGDIGEAQYRAFQRELSNCEAALQRYDSQMRSMGSEQTRFNQAQQGMQNYLQATGQSIDDLSSTLGSRLTNAIRDGSASSDQLEMALRRLGQAAGHSGDDLQEFQRLLRNVDGSNSLDEIRQDLDRIGDSADQASGKLRGIGSAASAAGGAIAGIGAISAATGLVEGTEEANRALAMLEIQADKAGIALEKTQEAQTALGATNHDINQIAETFGNLTQAGYTTEESINQISEALAGARILYGETFSAEGLAESITTTTQLGEVTGQLTDLLEKSGVNVDDFNAKMQSMSSVQERANYISQLLADQGLNAAYQEYANLNPEIVKQEQANQKLMESLTNLADQLTPLITQIAEFVAKVVDWVTNNEGLAATFVSIAAVIGTLVAVVSTLMPIITGIATVMGVGMAAASGIFLGAIAGIIAVIVAVIAIFKNWGAVTEWFKGVWSTIGSFLFDVWNNIATAATNIFSALGTFFSGIWTSISTTASKVWSGISSTLSAIWTGIVTVATSVFNSLKTGITNIFNGIKTTATNVWNAIKTAITTAINAIKTGVTTVFNSIKTTVTTVFNAIKSTATSIWNSIKSVITSAVNSVKSTVSSVFNAIKSTVTSVMEGIKSTITNAWNNVKSTVTSAVNGVKSIVTNVFNSLKSVVSSAMTGVRTAISNGWNAAKSFLTSINLTSIGRNIIEGLINGIKAMAGRVASAVKGVIDGVTKTAKNLLGINSPSKVFTQYGEWTGEGLEIGLDSMIKRVARSSQRLSDAVLNAGASLKNSEVKAQNYQMINQKVQMEQQAALVPQPVVNVDVNAILEALNQLAQRPVQTTVNMDGREVAQVVSVHQARQTRMTGLTKGVTF